MEQSYKETVNLPQTSMPMKAGLIDREPAILEDWVKKKVYEKRQERNRGAEAFILHDGPPYPNGDIHLGHALNKILKDLIVKYHLIKGHDTPYVPGWDCHGLPIETQLLKDLKKKEIHLDEVDTFRDQCKDYAMKYVALQRDQFKRLGLFGDFEKPYLTLTPSYEKGVIELFGLLAEKGLVYQGRKPIHWCAHCKTALAEAEIDYADETSPSIYVRFPLVRSIKTHQNVSLIVWTTTPWTLPANVAVAVNPTFEYVLISSGTDRLICVESMLEKLVEKEVLNGFKILDRFTGTQLEGLEYRHPFIDRVSPVVLAQYVSSEDGSGLVHIAPGHGYEDYLVGQQYRLPMIMPVDANGVFTQEGGKYAGQAVLGANKEIIADLQSSGMLLKVEHIKHSYPHCWRCHHPVIFRATEQWFIAMDGEEALRESTLGQLGEVRWFPDWGEKRIRGMVETRPDWCISRQRFWGIPIPAFHCVSCGTAHYKGAFNRAAVECVEHEGTNAWFQRSVQEILPSHLVCEKCGSSVFEKDRNIMDVWLESGSSHHAVLKQTDRLKCPADLYLEGSDQHRGWFQSSLLTSVGAFGVAPYKAVLTHGFTIDAKGQKMSKSLGNVIDPLKIISEHGADILRLWVCSTDFRNDVILSDNIIKQMKDAYSKMRNTLRFMISNLYDFDPTHQEKYELEEMDRWILSKLNTLISKVDRCYEQYELHQIYHAIYNFCVVDLSALYLDIQKDNLYCNATNSASRRSCQKALYVISRALIQMLSPVLSFSMEDVYGYLPGVHQESVFLESFPEKMVIKDEEAILDKFDELIRLRSDVNLELESMRQAKVIGSSLDARVIVTTPEPISAQELARVVVVSSIEVVSGKALSVRVAKAEGEKCPRCWKYDELSERGLCRRCEAVVE
ncbi:MAG: isoleucine--tRNA ligase [Candidatus Margulisiibacteriota bacterium]